MTTQMRIISRIFLTAAAAVVATSCGDVVRSGRAPVFLVIDSLQGARGGPTAKMAGTVDSDVITNVITPAPCTTDSPCPTVFSDPGEVTLRLSPKDIGPVGTPSTPSSNNEVTINRFHVAYRRTDGRNVQGVDVPYAFDGGTTGTVPASGNVTLSYVLVRNQAKQESPLIQLQYSGNVISTIADVTFYGRDQVGNDVSVTGSIQVDFANFGDTQ